MNALLFAAALLSPLAAAESPFPGPRGETLDSVCREDWHTVDPSKFKQPQVRFLHEFVKVPRDEVVAFALYTVGPSGDGSWAKGESQCKITAQLFPLMPDEPRVVRLELDRGNGWREVQKQPVLYPGWHAHFRLRKWDDTKTVKYRVRHGENAVFEGTIRANPRDQDTITVASLSCNSSKDRGGRETIVKNLLAQDPDLLFFAGDQSYDHKEHTAAWLLFGRQFADVIRDRPTVTIPDDHDIGQANLWGEGGIVAETMAGPKGGYYFPPRYVRMVEQQQTWHLPDPVDPRPIAQGIGVYFTRLRIGGMDFAILEDRKFKTGPEGAIPKMGPRPDHINDPSYDPKAIDLPDLVLLGERQLAFLDKWGQDWGDADDPVKQKCALSQTAFAGAVHLHGSADNRLLADLDCNGWPQTKRDTALRKLQACRATHLCGDQHLGVVIKHGIDAFRDGPWGFTSPATVNTIYGRWWWPEDEQAGGGEPVESPLPWTGDYRDGLNNRITMVAYANPGFTTMKEARQQQNTQGHAELADGYGLAIFNVKTDENEFQCWPRYADIAAGDTQFEGWPVRFDASENDGRKVAGRLPAVPLAGGAGTVGVFNATTGEHVSSVRVTAASYAAPVFDAAARYRVTVDGQTVLEDAAVSRDGVGDEVVAAP